MIFSAHYLCSFQVITSTQGHLFHLVYYRGWGTVENIWILVNFPRQTNEGQGISILSKLTAAMGYNYINRLYVEVHLNWPVINVSIRRIKGNIIPPHFRKAVTVFKWFFSSFCVSKSQKVLPQCCSSCADIKGFNTLIPARMTGWKRRFGARWDSNVCSPPECLVSEQCKVSHEQGWFLQPFTWWGPELAWSFQTLLSAV